MPSTDIPEGFKPNFVEELSEDDRILKDTIDVYKEREWENHGWGQGGRICILNAVNVARTGKATSGTNIPKGVLERIHRAIWPGSKTEKLGKDSMAGNIMSWNDGGGAKDKKHVVSVLKKALRLKDPK